MVYGRSLIHLGHKNVIEYCKRPFESLEDMHRGIFKSWNDCVSSNDTIYDLGDFMFRCKNANQYSEYLNGNIVHIGGNHDRKPWLKYARLDYGGLVIFMQHKPPTHIGEVDCDTDLVLCGHVHEKWKYNFIEDIPIINVGWDIWRKPVLIDTILKLYNKINNGKQ